MCLQFQKTAVETSGILIFGVVMAVGGGGFGLGAIVGMMIALARARGVSGESSESALGTVSNDYFRR